MKMLTAPRRDILERSFCRCQKKIEKCGWRIFVLLDFSLLLSGEERECITGDFKTKHDLLLVICLHSQKSPNTQLCLTLSLPLFLRKVTHTKVEEEEEEIQKNPSLCHRWCSSMLVQNDMRRWFSLSILKRNILSLSLHTFLSSRLWKSEQEKILFHLISVTFFLLLSFYSLLWFVIIYTEYVCVEFNDYALFLPYFMKLWKSFKYYKSHKKFFYSSKVSSINYTMKLLTSKMALQKKNYHDDVHLQSNLLHKLM